MLVRTFNYLSVPGSWSKGNHVVNNRCLHVTKLQCVTSVYCIHVFNTVFNGWFPGCQGRALRNFFVNAMYGSDPIWLHGHFPYCSVFVCGSKVWCLLTQRTGHVQCSIICFFSKHLKIGNQKIYIQKLCLIIIFLWTWPFAGILTFRQSHLGPTFQC